MYKLLETLSAFLPSLQRIHIKRGITEGEFRSLSEERLARLNDLSPSTKFVYAVLESRELLAQDEIVSRTLLPKRTVRYALQKLESANLIEEDNGVHDARRRRYRTKPIARRDGF